MAVTEIRNLTEFRGILKNNSVVIVAFGATWNGPCRVTSPIFERLAAQTEGIFFAEVDIDNAREISAECGIRSVPTFIAFKDGQKDRDLVGVNPDGLTNLVQQYK